MSYSKHTWTPARDIPSLDGKVILITGGSNGIGRQSAIDLAKHKPAEIWIAACSTPGAEAVITAIGKIDASVSAKFLEMDLTSFASIRNAARQFLAAASRLDILLLNAGVINVPVGSTTEQSYDMHFGTNHVGHALLLNLLVPLLRTTAGTVIDSDVRVIFVSSLAHRFPPTGGLNFESFKPPTGGAGLSSNALYGQRKLANVLYAREVAARYPQWTTASVHPGAVMTDLHKEKSDNWMMKVFQKAVLPFIGVDVEEGAKSQLWAATAEGVVSGEYYDPVGVARKGSALSKDKSLAKRLWEWTEKEFGGRIALTFPTKRGLRPRYIKNIILSVSFDLRKPNLSFGRVYITNLTRTKVGDTMARFCRLSPVRLVPQALRGASANATSAPTSKSRSSHHRIF
ncbi:putative oxidoreductase C736.13-like protein 7 [Colletotrichum chlorophyti]|uniref:Putative oxidoreductase C736.13-like protein 7 n=1 Tax=Colletotrichum chlorophyti TaxID=708187 RepID=A0A1Q8S8G8_9PEZI|nr:putative oxidoreductase C736.13-like protein 7 [Colletotrichum chlorophyti]